MTRQDWFFCCLGPLSILLIWTLLPWGRSEAWRAGDESAAVAVAELVGYAFEAPGDGRPLLVGRGAEADFRLHSAPVAPRAAWLTPPSPESDAWTILPAQPGLTLRLLGNERVDPEVREPRVTETSVRPWRRPGGALSRLMPFQRPPTDPVEVGCGSGTVLAPVPLNAVHLPGDGSAEPEVAWLEAQSHPVATSERDGLDLLACAGDGVWTRAHRPTGVSGEACASDLADWDRVGRCWTGSLASLWRDGPRACVDSSREIWGTRIGADRLMLPWSEISRDDFWIRASGPKPAFTRIGVAAEDSSAGCRGGDCFPAPLSICDASTGETLTTIGPLELRDGDLLAIGRTRFLIRTAAGSGRLEFIHVRDPGAPGFFSASAGHDAYHPNRRGLWNVPACFAEAAHDATRPAEEIRRQATSALTLVVEPEQASSEVLAQAAELTSGDRRIQSQINAAIRDHGVPHELPVVGGDQVGGEKVGVDKNGGRALLSLCTQRGDRRQLNLRMVSDTATGVGLQAAPDSEPERLLAEERTPSIGTYPWLDFGGKISDPREVVVDLGGNLVAITGAAGPRITRRTRAGLAAYLIFVLTVQAWLLTRTRLDERRRAERLAVRAQASAWPAGLATPTLQLMAGSAIVSLLFLGASFHLLIGLHPELVGKPDYLQAFLQGTVTVCVVLAAAAGFSSVPLGSRRGLEQRCAMAATGASIALLAAAAWWWWDAAGRPDGVWLSSFRDQASASAAGAPKGWGQLTLAGGGLGAVAAAVLFGGARLEWSRLAEHLARFAIRVPFVGFLVLAVAGLSLGLLQRSALAFELALAAGLAWYAAVYWAFVRHGRVTRDDDLRRRAAVMSMASGLLMLAFLAIFFFVGADLPDGVSFASVALGAVVLGVALKIARDERSTGLLRMVALWLPASILGMGFASFVLTDMGSVAAWLPALATGFFLWLVRPEEIENRREEPRKALVHLLLAFGAGLALLGLLDVFKRAVESLDWRVLERPQQRLALAEDISYITSGEWITQVRWLASQQDDTLAWVPNVNSDIAIFGLAANLGSGWAIAASLVLLGIAGCAALAADQALREGHAVALAGGDRLRPVLYRGLGLTSGMICVLLISQWLVHLATGVVLHLPITGLVFPWISHGNTTHLLYTAAVLLPMAAITALSGSRGR